MASAIGDEAKFLRSCANGSMTDLKRIAVFIVPSSMAFLAFGDVLAASVYQTGQIRT